MQGEEGKEQKGRKNKTVMPLATCATTYPANINRYSLPIPSLLPTLLSLFCFEDRRRSCRLPFLLFLSLALPLAPPEDVEVLPDFVLRADRLPAQVADRGGSGGARKGAAGKKQGREREIKRRGLEQR